MEADHCLELLGLQRIFYRRDPGDLVVMVIDEEERVGGEDPSEVGSGRCPSSRTLT